MYLCSTVSGISILEGCQPCDPFLVPLKMPVQHVKRHQEGIIGLAVSQLLSSRQGRLQDILTSKHGDVKEMTALLHRAF